MRLLCLFWHDWSYRLIGRDDKEGRAFSTKRTCERCGIVQKEFFMEVDPGDPEIIKTFWVTIT